MKPVRQVAASREQQAARNLGEAQERLAAQERKLEELIEYRDQYAVQFKAEGGLGFDAVRMQDFRVFLNRLNQAIEQQRGVIELCRQDCVRSRDRWLRDRTRSEALEKVVDRYRDEERREEERREQRSADERVRVKPDDV
jgi:flagellar FliJ protein